MDPGTPKKSGKKVYLPASPDAVNFGYFDEDPNQVAKRVCVVVASYDFKGSNHPEGSKPDLEERKGNSTDLLKLKKTFETNRKCTYVEFLNPSEKELLDLLENKQNQLATALRLVGNEEPSVLMLFILSHGNIDGKIYTKNHSDDLTTHKVLDSLKTCEDLKDSFKIVLFGPCRGGLQDHSASTGKINPTNSEIDNAYRVSSRPNKENFVIVYSTVETMLARRDNYVGSYMVQVICNHFNHVTEDIALPDLLTLVACEVQRNKSDTGHGQTLQTIYFPHRQLTIKEFRGNKLNPPSKIVSYPEKSESGKFWRTKAIIFCANESYQPAIDAYMSLKLMNFDTLSFKDLEKAFESFNDPFQYKISELTGVMFFCIFGNLSIIYQDQHEQICAGGIPILEVVSGFISSKDTKLAGKPKIFFFIDPSMGSDSPSPCITLRVVKRMTHYSAIMIVILAGKDAETRLTSIFEKLKAGETLENAVHHEIQEIYKQGPADGISPQIISTLPYSLHLPPDQCALLKLKTTRVRKGGVSQPSGSTFMPSNVDGLVRKLFKSKASEEEEGDAKSTREGQIILVSSAAGMGKSLLTKRFSRKCKEQFSSKGNAFQINLSGAHKFLALPKITMEKLIQETNGVECDLKKTWLICLDGFDEVSELNRDTVLKLIETMLKDCPHINLWITTRPYEAPSIKKVLQPYNYFRIEIQPLDEEVQREMFSLSPKSDGSIETFDVFEKLVGSAAGLLETPVLFKMVQELVEDQVHGEQKLNSFYVYENLILKILRDSSGKENVSKELVDLAKAATTYLGNDQQDYSFLVFNVVKTLNKSGLISLDEDKKGAKFRHRTLAEFLVARGILGLHQNPDETFSYALIFKRWSFAQYRYFLDQYFLSGKSISQEDFEEVKKDFQTFLISFEKKEFANICCQEGYLALFRMMGLNTGDEIFSNIKNFVNACRSKEDLAIELIDKGFKIESLFEEQKCKELTNALRQVLENNFQRLLEKIISKFPAEKGKLFEFVRGNDADFYPLKIAAEHGGKKKMLELIIDNGGDAKLNCPLKESVLHVAARFCDDETVSYLIEEQGLDPLKIDKFGQNCLHNAAKGGNLETVNYLISLLKPSKMINATDKNDRTALHLAVKKGHLGVVEALYGAGADAKLKDEQGLTALHHAIAEGNLPIVEFLVKKDSSLIHGKTDEGQSALHLAAEEGHLPVIKALCAAKADVQVVDNDNWNALHFACYNYEGSFETVEWLVENYPSLPDGKTKKGLSALHVAAQNKQCDDELFEYLGKKGPDPLAKFGIISKDFLDHAAEGGNVRAVNYFLAKYPQRYIDAFSNGGKTALLLAIKGGSLEVIKALRAAGADVKKVDDDDWNALHYAFHYYKGNLETIKWLIDHFPSLRDGKTKDGKTPLQLADTHRPCDAKLSDYLFPSKQRKDSKDSLDLAGEGGTVEEVKIYFIDKDPKRDRKARYYGDETARLPPAYNNNLVIKADGEQDGNQRLNTLRFLEECRNYQGLATEVCSLEGLVKKDPSVINGRTVEGLSALHLAAQNEEGDDELFEFLVKNGLDPLERKGGPNFLDFAAKGGNVKAVNYIIAKYPKRVINARSKGGYTAMLIAAYFGKLPVIKALRAAKADVKVVDDDNWNALHFASIKGNLETVKWLIKKHPSLLEGRTNSGLSALHLAAQNEKGDVELFEYLVKQKLSPFEKSKDGKDFLDHAAERGNVKAVNHFLAKFPERDINARSEGGKTALLLAAEEGDLEVVKALCAAGADVKVVDNDNWNALHFATKEGNLETIEWLFENYPSLIKGKTNKNEKPVTFVAQNRVKMDTMPEPDNKSGDRWCLLIAKMHLKDVDQ